MRSLRPAVLIVLLCVATTLAGQQRSYWRWPLSGGFWFETGPWGSWTRFVGGRGSTQREPAPGSVALQLAAATADHVLGVLPRQAEVIAVYRRDDLWSVYRHADTSSTDLVELGEFWHLFWHPTIDLVYRPRAVLPPLTEPPARPRFSVDIAIGDRQTLLVEIVMEAGFAADRLPARVAVFLDQTKLVERYFVTYGAWLQQLRAKDALPIAQLELPAGTRVLTIWSYDFDGRSFHEPITLIDGSAQ